MPTYNRGGKIKKTIESVLNQTYKNFELIIVNDGSTDDTEEVIKEFDDSRIKYIKSKNWGGPARPRNIGIKYSKGEYVNFLDDDDLWLSNKLDVVHKYTVKFPQSILFCHDESYILNGRFLKNNNYGPYKKNMYESLLFNKNCISTSATTVSRLTLNKVGGFSENRDYISCEDLDLWIRLSQIGEFTHIPKILGEYHVKTDKSDNISQSAVLHANAGLQVKLSHLKKREKLFPNDKKNYSGYGKAYRGSSIKLNRGGQYAKSIEDSLKSLQYNWIDYKAIIVLIFSIFKIQVPSKTI